EVLLGNLELMGKFSVPVEAYSERMMELHDQGKTISLLALDRQPVCLIGLADKVKESSAPTIKALKKMGLDIVMLTGDNERTAKAIARTLGIDTIFANVRPSDKEEIVKKLQKGGKVAMVGDGINDAPALAAADVGIAIGSGADVAVEAADVALVGGDPRAVASAIRLSRATMRTIRQNLGWAFGYNVILIPVAMGALFPAFGLLLNPALAAGAM